ncbi:SHOCT domain-containing protein [Streptomyces sp. G-G2]|uniref:SHOCT domain-containing protein n=1 Tax=Streptomyces sp. G-G2 TaxID=3046201 RepID=UPI0024B973E3|nr:SHOCT domain-containing protein [Streptomyces sp. G-G2]MDJ0380083.1 SHOCT domain-containing protein [Streptomyces sp. G-G2]
MTNTLAYDGPGPWILFFPLVWAAVALVAVTVLRRTVWRGGRGGRGPRAAPRGRVPYGEHSPITVLGLRFASGEIDEDAYWRRLSVLDEQFGRTGPGAGGPGRDRDLTL